MSTTLSDDDFRKVAPTGERLDITTVIELLSAPSGSRPRIYALWQGQIVKVPSTHYVDQYATDAQAWWVSGTTVADMIHRS